jgi:glycosyltransferase involved in cell wall biosynthesis
MSTQQRIALIGSLPPPIGGVTIHVQRLFASLRAKDVDVEVLDFKIVGIIKGIQQLSEFSIVHLHLSNPLFRLFLVIVCRLLQKKVVVTIHGDLGRFSLLKNKCDDLSVYLADSTIVLNQKSLRKAIRLNPHSKMISAYIPPLHTKELPVDVMRELLSLKQKDLYATNCYNISFDKDQKEIYGISGLIAYFEKHQVSKRLIISDPTGNYRDYIKANFNFKMKNITWLCFEHDFFEVLRHVKGFIRNTTTDGDSLSVHEALSLGVPTYTTDVVSRPKGAILYSNIKELDTLLNIDLLNRYKQVNTVSEIIQLYSLTD